MLAAGRKPSDWVPAISPAGCANVRCGQAACAGLQNFVDKSVSLVDAFNLWLFTFEHEKCLGDGMKNFVLGLAFVGAAFPALAGGLVEPAMDPAVVAAETASSSGDNWVGIVMTLLVFGVALAD